MSKESAPIPSEKLDLYDALVARFPTIERKGKTTPYTAINGNMFSFLSEDGVLGLRLPKTYLDEFLEAHSAKLFVRFGSVMKEYVEVPSIVFADEKVIDLYFEMAIAYAHSLKPK